MSDQQPSPTQKVEQARFMPSSQHPAWNAAQYVVKEKVALQLDTELEAAQKELVVKQLLPFHGCFSGDCPHDNSNQCVEALKEYVHHRWSLMSIATKS